VTQLTVEPAYSTDNPQTICSGDSYTFNGNTYTLAGDYNDTLSTVNGCDSIILTQLTVVDDVALPVVSSNSPVCAGTDLNLTVESVDNGQYSWNSNSMNGFSSTYQNPIISEVTQADAGIYFIVVSVNGCSSETASINIIVKNCDINIPEGFSPNGDGVNDEFVIRGIDLYSQNTLVIFNRWGDKVFEASPYTNNWDGSSEMGIRIGDGKLPVGTYFYIFDLGDGSDVYKGTIYLNR
ncbi:MAG: gliding motility-associated C-terminal domain-containing protein, partial [Bacteroidota bacterium]